MKSFRKKYKQPLDSFKSVNFLLLCLEILLAFVVKGGADLIRYSHYYWSVYLHLTCISFLGSLLLSLLILVVECVTEYKKDNHS